MCTEMKEKRAKGEEDVVVGKKERVARCLLIVIPFRSENFYRFRIDVIRCC
jgi:hypothetical protein